MKSIQPAAILFSAVSFVSLNCASMAEQEGKGVSASGQHELVMALDKIVTAEMAAEASGFAVADGKMVYKPSPKYPQTDVLTYSWSNGRKKMAGAIEVPTDDTVKFGWLRRSSIESMKAKTYDPNFKDILEKVDGLGEFALWNTRDQQLIVFQKGYEFSVWVSVSGDVAVNRTKSIELAGNILSGPLK